MKNLLGIVLMLDNHTNFVIYLIKDSIATAFYSRDIEASLLEMSWLMSHDNSEQSFNWYCSLVGLCPTWTRQKILESASVELHATDRAAGNFLNYG